MRRFCTITIITLLSGLAACTESDSLYCHIPARLVVDNAYQAQALYTACNSLGEFCSVTMDGQKIYFQGSKEKSELNRVALNNYDNTILGLGGLIIGLPSLPEIGKDVSQVVCFDLNCPNCYEQYGGISKRMELSHADGTSRCNGCHRTYDLNSMGIVSDGESGRALFRYRVSYVGTALVVSNR
ncbi:MAG: hypothetical protein ACI4B5_04410 [Bacteroidaceae bacterium]